MVRSPEKLAWFTLLGAQIACLIVTATTLGGGYWFFFSSSVDLTADLRVARGTVGILQSGNAGQEAVNRSRILNGGEQILVDDAASQGTIEFVDANNDDLVVANVTFFPGSRAEFVSARRPRFNLGDNRYEIQMEHQQGRIEIQIPPDLPHEFSMLVRGTQGEIRLNGAGFYILNSNAETTTVFARSGTAEIKPYKGQLTHVPTDYSGVVDALQSMANITILRDDLLADPLFVDKVNNQPSPWACEIVGDPRGDWETTVFDGRYGLHNTRVAEGPGSVGCRQAFGLPNEGLDVTPYRTLKIRASVKIMSQSITLCGVDASECPLMLQVTYINQNGADQIWYHGFYAYEYPEQAHLLRLYDYCPSCIEPHERINPDTWYTFESRNMFEFPVDFKPARIKEIRFYSSGHSFDVAVGEVTLIVEN